jgi:hypothetical protein
MTLGAATPRPRSQPMLSSAVNDTSHYNRTEAHELFPNASASGMAHHVIGFKWAGPAVYSPKKPAALGRVSALLRRL